MINKRNLVQVVTLLFVIGCYATTSLARQKSMQEEVIYHVFQRSFYDSNGDGHGDLNGLRNKLDYLQDLGVTSLLLLPLYQSAFYHNYFADSFEAIDPRYGTWQDYVALVKAVHRRGMKIYLDMETQYITEDHLWYKDSYQNPASVYSDYLLYNGAGNTNPEPIIFNLTALNGYDGAVRKVTTVNLLNKKVLDYNIRLFTHFVDPDNDGHFEDGVDGFRLDHAMDDLDHKGKFTHLFTVFWQPLLTAIRIVNPALKIVAEQAEWSDYGFDYLNKAGVDRVFAFRLQQAIRTLNKTAIAAAADTTFSGTPTGRQQVVFIENHDMERFSSAVQQHPAKLVLGAVLNLLTGGVPAIYYGQELGMKGAGGFGKFGNTDGNDIPQREAFEWYKADTGKGMALWYKNTGPWWLQTNLKPGDGLSLEEEQPDTQSLYNCYKTLLRLRKATPALVAGKYVTLNNNNAQVYTFLRYTKGQAVLVAVNLSPQQQQLAVEKQTAPVKIPAQFVKKIWGSAAARSAGQHITFTMPPYGTGVWELK